MNIQALLSRRTNSKNFIPEIDGLRFIAIFTVLIFHLNSALASQLGFAGYGIEKLGGSDSIFCWGWWVIRLDLGVKLFFSISGFILAVPFVKANMFLYRVDIMDYFKRRLLRLEPPFIISLIGFFLIHLFILNTDINQLHNHFFIGLLYLHGLFYGTPNPINPVTWSLEVEAQFYILVPMLFAVFSFIKRSYLRVITLVLLSALGVYFKSYIHELKFNHLYASVLFFITNFVTGILFAYFYLTRDENWFKYKNYLWDVLAVVSFFLLFFYYKPQANWMNNILFNISVFLLFISAFKSIFFNKLMRAKMIYLIGGMCYSIYLLHYAILHLIVSLSTKFILFEAYTTNLLFQSIIALPLVIVISGVYFVLIEKPCMDKNWPTQLNDYIRTRLIYKNK